jgi:hypothetical protein
MGRQNGVGPIDAAVFGFCMRKFPAPFSFFAEHLFGFPIHAAFDAILRSLALAIRSCSRAKASADDDARCFPNSPLPILLDSYRQSCIYDVPRPLLRGGLQKMQMCEKGVRGGEEGGL